MLNHQHKRLVRAPALPQPVNRKIRHDVGAMPFNPLKSSRRLQIRVVIKPLPWEHRPIIKSLRLSLQVGFAKNCRCVTSLLQQLRKRLLVPVERVSIVHETIFVTVFPRHDDGSTGSANRICAEAVFKQNSLGRQFVDIGRRVNRL